MLQSSSFPRPGLTVFTCPMQPNVRRYETLGLRPCHASYGVIPFRALVGERFKMNTAVLTASPQNSAGIAFAFIIERAIPTMV